MVIMLTFEKKKKKNQTFECILIESININWIMNLNHYISKHVRTINYISKPRRAHVII